MKPFFPLALSLLALAAAAAPEMLLEHDFAQINGGKPYDLLLPADRQPFACRVPFAAGQELVIRFPYRDGAELTAISAEALYESAGIVRIQQLDEQGEWRDLATADQFRFRFALPVRTRALRVLFSEITNRDHDTLQFNQFKAEGRGLGPKQENNGLLALSCNAPDNVFDLSPWYRPDRLPEIAAAVTNPDAEPHTFTVRGEFRHYAGGVAETAEPALLRLGPGETGHYRLAMRGKQPGPYIGVVTVSDATGPRARQALIVGLRDPEIAAGNRAPEPFRSPAARRGETVPAWPELLERRGALWASDISHCIGGRRTPDEHYFAKVAADGAELAMAITSYHDFEPLPGVYNFKWADRMVAMAGRNRMGLEFGLWHWDFDGPSQFWLKSELRRGLDGGTSSGWLGIPSLFSEKFTRHAQRAAEVLVQRYRDCPEIQLWSLHPYGVVDHDTTDIYDTNPEALAAFHRMLAQKYGSVTALNRAYGSAYASFDEVPVPESRSDRLLREGRAARAVTVVDRSARWRDWLDFYHARTVWFRDRIARLVRRHDPKRALSGINASGGVGDAHGQLWSLAETGGFYGDQGLNITHYFRRFLAQRRYGLPLRHEDIAPVKVGRGVTAATMTERCNWDVFQSALLGLRHFNFVFSCWTDNEFYRTVFANGRIRQLIRDAARLEGDFIPAGLHHSFLSDAAVGNYRYRSISVYRWWLMNALYTAMLQNGELFEPFSDAAGIGALTKMKLLIDDGSPVVAPAFAAELERFVRNGGRAVLTARSGEYLEDENTPSYALLRRLGYAGTLTERDPGNAALTFADLRMFTETRQLTVNNYTPLTVPEGGRAVATLPDGRPGAVLWPFGRGEVLLLAGNPGPNDEIALKESVSPDGKAHTNTIWQQAEPKLVKEFVPLLRDLARWGNVTPEYRLSGSCYSAMRSGPNERLLCIFNPGEQPEQPTLTLPGAAGPATLAGITLTSETALGEYTAEQLRNGVRLPEIPAGRFLAVRLLH